MRRNWIWVAMLVVASLLLTACPSSVPAGTGTARTPPPLSPVGSARG